MKRISSLCLIVGMLLLPAFVSAAKAGTSVFTGIVEHVSADNIKVTNPKDNTSLSFLILPKFDKIFSSDGKTTRQMADIKAGNYVKVYYDQKALGARHADRILLLTQENAVKAKE